LLYWCGTGVEITVGKRCIKKVTTPHSEQNKKESHSKHKAANQGKLSILKNTAARIHATPTTRLSGGKDNIAARNPTTVTHSKKRRKTG